MGFLDFFLVTCRVLHVFSVAAWIGGLGFLGGVAGPVFRHFGERGEEIAAHIERRFVGFVWTVAWGAGVSGLLLMLMSDKFLWLDYSTPWRWFLLGKQIIFLCMIAASLVISASLKEAAPLTSTTAPEGDLSDVERLRWRVTLLQRLNIMLGIAALILAACMQ